LVVLEQASLVIGYTGAVVLATGVGLEVLIAPDVIETLLRPGLDELVRLGTIVVIRAVIGFSLNAELAHGKGHPAR
jgi:uncharacterized membrane protein